MDKQKNYMIGVDIGGTNIRIGGTNIEGNLISPPYIISSRDLFPANKNPIPALANVIQSFVANHTNYTLSGICIGFPGTVHRNKQIVLSCPNLPAFTNIDIAKPLKCLFHVPVIVEHDVLLLLSLDLRLLDIEDADCVISFYMGTGLGNGIYIHNHFLDGKNGVAGELGHIPVYGKRDPCPCGNEGCIELYCSGKALERIHENEFPALPFKELFLHYEETPALQDFINFMAIAFSTEINLLDPNYIILGGGVIQMPNFPKNALINKIRLYARKPYPEKNLEFKDAAKSPAAGVLGAGIYMWKLFA